MNAIDTMELALLILGVLYLDWCGFQILHRVFGAIDDLRSQVAAAVGIGRLAATTPSKLNARYRASRTEWTDADMAPDAPDGAEEGHVVGIIAPQLLT